MSLEIKLFNPKQLNEDQWAKIQGLQLESFRSVINRPGKEIDRLVNYGDFTRYYASHLDPNVEVGGRFRNDQVFTKPRVAVAFNKDAGNDIIGYAYSAHNVSGNNNLVNTAKRLSVVKNYLWLREFAVEPNLQKKGIARRLGRVLLSDAMPLQPVTAYIWPDEINFLHDVLSNLGFKATGDPKPVPLFGQNKKQQTDQQRMAAPTVHGVKVKLNRAA